MPNVSTFPAIHKVRQISQQIGKEIFAHLHNLSHPGVKASLCLIKSRYFWPEMDKNIQIWTRECTSCQQAKIHKHTKSEILPFEKFAERFETTKMDQLDLKKSLHLSSTK